MKKFIQISLIIVLMFVLFQTAAGVVTSAGSVGSRSTSISTTAADTSAEGMQMATECLVRVKGVICVRPNVGWNS